MTTGRELDEETVERVARAICADTEGPDWWDGLEDEADPDEPLRDYRNHYRKTARAALAAIGSGTGRDAVIEDCVRIVEKYLALIGPNQERAIVGLIVKDIRALASPEKVTAPTPPTKEWCLAAAEREGDTEISAGILAALPTPPALWDDPELDATDGAHPAWRRGDDHGVRVTVECLVEALDGKDDGRGVVGYEPLEKLRRRLIALSVPPAASDLRERASTLLAKCPMAHVDACPITQVAAEFAATGASGIVRS